MIAEQAHAFVTQLAKILELVGVATIIGGIVLAAVVFIAHGTRTRDWQPAYEQLRSNLGRGILLGLGAISRRGYHFNHHCASYNRERRSARGDRCNPNIPQLLPGDGDLGLLALAKGRK